MATLTPNNAASASSRLSGRLNVVLWLLVVLGIALRVKEYAFGRSFWLDEAMLANNIADRSFVGLTRPLDYNQAAPIGLLFLYKAAYLLFGQTDLALRTVPLFSGIALLVVAKSLLQRLCAPWAAAFGLALFALNRQLNFFSVEFKQYETDALVAAILFLALVLHRQGRLRFHWFTAIGAISLLFSHPALFSVAALGGVLVLEAWAERRREPRPFRKAFLAGGVWAVVETLNYLLLLRPAENSSYLRNFWAEHFMPGFDAGLSENLAWLGRTVWKLVDFAWVWQATRPSPFTLLTLIVVNALFLVGLYSLFRRDWRLGAFFLLLLAASLGACALHLYPLSTRMIVYLIPFLCLFPAVGLDCLVGLVEWRWAKGLLSTVALLTLLAPTSRAIKHFSHPRQFQEVKQTEKILQSLYRPGDVVLVDMSAEFAFRFYQKQYDFHPVPAPVLTTWYEHERCPAIIPYLETHRTAGRIWLISGVICGLGGQPEGHDFDPAKDFPNQAAGIAVIDSHAEAEESDLYLFHLKDPGGIRP